jgi:hypothetical protein
MPPDAVRLTDSEKKKLPTGHGNSRNVMRGTVTYIDGVNTS